MATKKRDRRRAQQFDQLSFMRALDHVESWAGLSASEEELDRLGSLLADSSEVARTLFADVNELATSLTPSFNNAQAWGKTDAQTLALLVCGGEAVRRGARTCAPASQELPSATHQLSLYLLILHSRAVTLHADPAPWVRLVVLLWILGPRAAREIMRRYDKDLGLRYGLAAYLWGRPDAEDERQELLKELQWLSWKHLSPIVKREVHKKDRKAPLPELMSALSQVLDRRRDRDGRKMLADPLSGLLEGIDGRLNIFPRAVANQLTKDLRILPRVIPVKRKARYRTVEVNIDPATKYRPPQRMPQATCATDHDTPIPSLDALPALDQLSPLDVLLQREECEQEARLRVEVDRLCKESGKHRVGYEAFTKVLSKVELAKKYRTSPDTIARWQQNFLHELRDRLTTAFPSKQ